MSTERQSNEDSHAYVASSARPLRRKQAHKSKLPVVAVSASCPSPPKRKNQNPRLPSQASSSVSVPRKSQREIVTDKLPSTAVSRVAHPSVLRQAVMPPKSTNETSRSAAAHLTPEQPNISRASPSSTMPAVTAPALSPQRNAKFEPLASPGLLASEAPLSDPVSERRSSHRDGDNPIGGGALLSEIRELYRARQDWLNTQGSIEHRIRAIGRRMGRGEKPKHIIDSDWTMLGKRYTDAQVDAATLQFRVVVLSAVQLRRKQHEKALIDAAKRLPVYSTFWQPVHGLGALGLGLIIGEAGDVGSYGNPAKLWKRFGLAVIGGKAQRKCTDKVAAAEHGYSPRRRAVMFVVGDSLIKKQNAYRGLYLARKAVEQQKVPDGSKMLWHRRAKRYMEKRLLRDLWRAWRGHAVADIPWSPASPLLSATNAK